MIDIQNDLILICLKATWQDRGGDGKDGVKWHHKWQKIWGTSKFWQLIWFFFFKCWKVWGGQSESVWVYWHQAGHEVTEVQVGAARPHFSRQQSRWGVRSHVVHPSEHTHTQVWVVLLSAGGKEDLSSMGEMSLIHQWLTDMPLFPFHHCSCWADRHASAPFCLKEVHLLRIYKGLCAPNHSLF